MKVTTHINEVTRCLDGAVIESFRDYGFDTNIRMGAMYVYRTVTLTEPDGCYYSFGEMVWDFRR